MQDNNAGQDLSSAKNPVKGRIADIIIVVLILAAASIWILSNLGNQYLWQDEAQTALISKTVLAHGVPMGTDGINSFSQDGGSEFGKDHVWKYHTWLPFYVLAGFLAAFGSSQFVARLPFALFGIATVLLTYFYAKSLLNSRRAGVFAAVVLLMSIPFLVLSRQCRYYAPGMFFSLLSLYAYSRMLSGSKRAPVTFVLSSILLFQSQYIHYIALMAAVVFHSLLFKRDKFRQVLLLSAATGIVTIPWLIWLSSIIPAYRALRTADSPDMPAMLVGYIGQIARYILHPGFLLIPLALGILSYAKIKRPYRSQPEVGRGIFLLLFFAAFNLIISAMSAPSPLFRHLAPVIPVLCVLFALMLESAARAHVALALVAIALFANTQPIGEYFCEITRDFDGPVEGIVKYLKQHGNRHEVVATTYDDLPIEFHTGMRVVGGLTGEDLSPAKTADWIILRRHYICDRDRQVRAYILRNIDPYKYKPIALSYPDTPSENRESPSDHLYWTAKDEMPVIILKRIK